MTNKEQTLLRSRYFPPTAIVLLLFLFVIILLISGDFNFVFYISFAVVFYLWLMCFVRDIKYYDSRVEIYFPFRLKTVNYRYNENFVIIYNHKGARNPPNLFFIHGFNSKKKQFMNSLLFSFEIYNRKKLIDFLADILRCGVSIELQVSTINFSGILKEIKHQNPNIIVKGNKISRR